MSWKKIRNSLILGATVVGVAMYTSQYFPIMTGLIMLALVALLIFLNIEKDIR